MSDTLTTPSRRQPAESPGAPGAQPEAAMRPPVDVVEDASGITLYADLPGVPKDQVQVRVETDALTIEGEIRLSLPEGMDASHIELPTPRFRRTFTLSKELDTERVSAECQNGVLRLRIPKAEHAQPRRIEVRVA